MDPEITLPSSSTVSVDQITDNDDPKFDSGKLPSYEDQTRALALAKEKYKVSFASDDIEVQTVASLELAEVIRELDDLKSKYTSQETANLKLRQKVESLDTSVSTLRLEISELKKSHSSLSSEVVSKARTTLLEQNLSKVQAIYSTTQDLEGNKETPDSIPKPVTGKRWKLH